MSRARFDGGDGEVAVLFELISPYIPLVVLGAFWLVAIRPLLRDIHMAPSPVTRTGSRRRRR
jgi:hypothetical protein